MAPLTLRSTLEQIAETYASLALQRKTIDAQMDGLKRFLVDGIGIENEIVDDQYIITISPGITSKIWANPKFKDDLEKALVQKGLLKLHIGAPFPIIRFKGDPV